MSNEPASPTTALTRRRFLSRSGLTLVGAGAAVALRPSVAGAAAPSSNRSVVVIFCRGGYDGLSLVPPVAAAEYTTIRPGLAVPQGVALPLTGPAANTQFAFHPAATRLAGMYSAGKVAIVHGAGLSTETRSHFEAQSYVESGVVDMKSTATGWAGRWLTASAASADHPLRSVAIGGALPPSLRGSNAVAASGFDALTLFDWGPELAQVDAATRDLYQRGDTHPALANWASTTLDTLGELDTLGSTDRPATFANTDIGNNLWPIARLIEAGLPVEVAHAEMGGWDTHDHMGAAADTTARMHRQIQRLDAAIGAFYDRLGAAGDKVTTIVLTEFGRRTYENASGGCDHGRAFPMLVIGAGVNPGVRGRWPGLAAGALDDGDVAVTTDYRAVISEVLSRRLGASSSTLGTVFPRFNTSAGWTDVVRA